MVKIFEISFIIFLLLASYYEQQSDYYEQQSKKWKEEDEPELMEVSCMNSKKFNACTIGEFSVDIDGTSYLVIYGTHINGGWCAIPSHSISCEIGTPMDIFYNTERLSAVGIDQAAAIVIAGKIRDYSESK